MPPASLALLERTARQTARGRWGTDWLAGYTPVRFSGPFGGFPSAHAVDSVPQGPNKRGITKATDLLNMCAYPFGSITSFPGHANLNSVAANSGKAITGFGWLGEISQTLLVAVQGKVGKDVAGTWVDITGAATITDDDDNFMDVAYLNATAVLTFLKKDTPLKWTGSGDVATLGGSPRTGVKGGFGKGGVNAIIGHLFRIYRTGNPALPYGFERVETGGVGPISNEATIAVGQDLCFLTADGNVQLIRGNQYVPNGIGRSIQRTLLADYSKSRLEFASMGLLRERGLLGLSVS